MGLQLLAHGSQYSLIQLVDGPVQLINSIVTFLLARTLVSDGEDQSFEGVSYGLGVRGKELPHGRVVWIQGQVLS